LLSFLDLLKQVPATAAVQRDILTTAKTPAIFSVMELNGEENENEKGANQDVSLSIVVVLEGSEANKWLRGDIGVLVIALSLASVAPSCEWDEDKEGRKSRRSETHLDASAPPFAHRALQRKPAPCEC